MIYQKRHEPDSMYFVRLIANNPYSWSIIFAWLIATVIYFGL